MKKKMTVKMPDIGEGVVEGEVVEWLKNINDLLNQDEPTVVVMTDKATVELPAPRPGKLTKQYFAPGQIAFKDKPLYDIEYEDDDIEDIQKEKSAPSLTQSIPSSLKQPQATLASTSNNSLAIPSVRRLAKQLGINLDLIKGSGKDGRVLLQDLQSSKPSKPLVSEGDEEKQLTGIARLMAEKMTASKDHIPHFSYFETTDATRLVSLRKNFKDKGASDGIEVTYMPFLIRALSLCITKHPEINSTFDEESNKLIIHRHQNIGIAINAPQGLIVAVLHDAQALNLESLIQAYNQLKAKALKGALEPHEVKNSTITISNFGVLGGKGLWATPIINYPEAAILAVDRIQKLPIVVNDKVMARDSLNVSWSFDHRFIDGEMAAAVSCDFCTFIQNPASLL